jgi:hypothetical protein
MSDIPVFFGDNKFLFESGSSDIKVEYDVVKVPNLDIAFEDPFIYSATGEGQVPKKILYDSYSGDGHLFFVPYPVNPTTIFSGSGIIFEGYFDVIRNNLLLTSGVDYEINDSNFILADNSGFDNDAFYFIKFSPLVVKYSGEIGVDTSCLEFENTYFNNYTSKVYVNGRRLIINEDYIENAKNDLISGQFRFPTETDYI